MSVKTLFPWTLKFLERKGQLIDSDDNDWGSQHEENNISNNYMRSVPDIADPVYVTWLASSAGTSFFPQSPRAKNAGDWWRSARDQEKEKEERRNKVLPFSSFWSSFLHKFSSRERTAKRPCRKSRKSRSRCLGYNRWRYVSKSFILAKCVLFLILHVRKINVICQHLKVYLLFSAVCWSVDGEKRSNCDNCLGLAEKFCGH